MTKIIGLTGGIGSGKTLVAKYIESLGIPVYIADEAAKELLNSKEVIDEIVLNFGDKILEKGKIDRKELSELVFNDPNKLEKLNSIVHPQVKKHFDAWLNKNTTHPFVVKEAAILFESGSDKYCDKVITVTAPLETRLQRVIERDQTDKASVLKRIKSQWSDEQRIAKSDYIIHNLSVKETYKQTDEILQLLKNQ